MEKRRTAFSLDSFLDLVRLNIKQASLQEQIYLCLLFVIGVIEFISATISWIQLPSSFLRVIVLYAYALSCVLLIWIAYRFSLFLIFEFNIATIALLAYLYFPSGGAQGAVPLFATTNTLLSWILLFGSHPIKIVISMTLQAGLVLGIPLVDIFNPGLVAPRYPDRFSQTVNLMIYGSIVMVFIIAAMGMWSRLFQAELNRLLSQIEIDDLTGAYRKGFMYKLIDQYRSSSNFFQMRHSVVFIDVDNFKQVNDSFGHVVGDEVLKEFVRYAREHLRSSDLLCRFGGDEFLFFLPNTRSHETFQIVERLRSEVADRTWSSQAIHVTISAGVGELIFHTRFDDTIDLIDKSMYESKKTGKNKVVLI